MFVGVLSYTTMKRGRYEKETYFEQWCYTLVGKRTTKGGLPESRRKKRRVENKEQKTYFKAWESDQYSRQCWKERGAGKDDACNLKTMKIRILRLMKLVSWKDVLRCLFDLILKIISWCARTSLKRLCYIDERQLIEERFLRQDRLVNFLFHVSS